MNLFDALERMDYLRTENLSGNLDCDQLDLLETELMCDALVAIAEGAEDPAAIAAVVVKAILPNFKLGVNRE